jgi:hypothetical protein
MISKASLQESVRESQSLLIAAMTHFRRSVSTTRRIDSCCAEWYRLGRHWHPL